MDYKITAPILEATGLTELEAKVFITEKEIVEIVKVEPEVTKEKVEAIGDIVKNSSIESNNGFTAIAQRLGLKTSQVKSIFKEFDKIKTATAIIEEPKVVEIIK